MATIAPFKGVRYNSKAVGPLGCLVGPSRDVISEQEKKAYYALHPLNFCRLLFPEDINGESCERSAAYLKQWLNSGHLIRDRRPGLYVYEISYKLPGDIRTYRRTGFSCLLRLEEYSASVVRPHERTFSGVKEHLVKSLDRCQANLSQIFCFYDDPKQKMIETLKAARWNSPDMEFKDAEGIEHKVWRIHQPDVIRDVTQLASEMPFYIADGHHRYESCLAYSRYMQRSQPGHDPLSAFNFTLAHAVCMQDPGITLLPAHRLLKNLEGLDISRFIERMRPYFNIESCELYASNRRQAQAQLAYLKSHAGKRTALGLVVHGSSIFYLLTLKPQALDMLDIHPCKEDLDAEILSQLVLGKGLGLGRQDRGNEQLFTFESDHFKAMDMVRSGVAQLGVLVNPTRIEQVKRVADAGLFMPRKSSNFFPKIAAGLLVNPMEEDQLVQAPHPHPSAVAVQCAQN